MSPLETNSIRGPGGLRVAMCQFAADRGKEGNLDRVLEMVEEAAADSADVAVFPEYAMNHFRGASPDFLRTAESLDGPFVEALRAQAQRSKMSIILGITESIPGEPRAYNTVLAVDHQGQIAATYRKVHLYDAFGNRESDRVKAGPLTEPAVFEVSGVRIGILTCYDLRFPEPARLHANAHVDVLVYPAAWALGARKELHWRVLAQARALENTLFVIAVGQTPDEGIGRSVAVAPTGEVIAELDAEERVEVFDIHVDQIPEVRRINPSLANRRYGTVPLE